MGTKRQFLHIWSLMCHRWVSSWRSMARYGGWGRQVVQCLPNEMLSDPWPMSGASSCSSPACSAPLSTDGDEKTTLRLPLAATKLHGAKQWRISQLCFWEDDIVWCFLSPCVLLHNIARYKQDLSLWGGRGRSCSGCYVCQEQFIHQ